MKKILALVSFLLVAAACTNQPPTNTGTNTNTNTAVAKVAAPSEADLIVKEKSVWEALKTKDYAAFGNLLTSDYLEVTDEGVLDKPGIVADAKDFVPTEVTYSDWKLLPIDNDAAIITYNLNLKATYKGTALPPGPYRAAAAWVNRDGKWQALYYQQTPVKTPPPAPPSAAKPSPSKPEKAGGSPLGAAGPDPIANEKLVWDAFKSKNYDGFAALLDPAFFELESMGVYDKAGAVKGASEFDANRFELSEWKTAKLDNDAALVTYLVKPMDPKFDQERHSTIWVNRSGKWVALLHVGTPVAKPPAK